MPEKYRCKYTYENRLDNPEHLWTVVGAHAGLHLWIRDCKRYAKSEDMRYSGGLEIHYRYPPEYMENQPPSHDECFLLKAPCWHDGSSLQASEIWIPRWLMDPHDHDRMFRGLCHDLDTRNVRTAREMLSAIAAQNSDDPVLANIEQGVRDGLAKANV